MTLCIDFNGVIHDHKNPVEGRKMGKPMKGAVQAMRELSGVGTIYIFTDMANTSDGWRAVNDWLEFYHVPFDYITNSKPKGMDVFLDDKAIRFESWDQALSAIMNLDEY